MRCGRGGRCGLLADLSMRKARCPARLAATAVPPRLHAKLVLK